jgi:hypothetical protein
MTNRQIKNIILGLQMGSKLTLNDICDKAGIGRSNFSVFLNLKEEKEATPNMMAKLEHAYPGLFKPNKPNVSDRSITGESATASPGANDKYVQLMEKVISALEKDKAWLQGIIETNLVGISDQTKVALGYQKAWVDYIAERDASGNPKKGKEIRARLDKLIASKLGIGDEMGIATDGRN